MAITVDISDVMDRLNSIGDVGNVATSLQSTVPQIERDAKLVCPVDTGNLRSSINTTVEANGNNVIATVGTNVEYAPFVEYGTKKMSARPFLIPSFESNKEWILETLLEDVMGGK